MQGSDDLDAIDYASCFITLLVTAEQRKGRSIALGQKEDRVEKRGALLYGICILRLGSFLKERSRARH